MTGDAQDHASDDGTGEDEGAGEGRDHDQGRRVKSTEDDPSPFAELAEDAGTREADVEDLLEGGFTDRDVEDLDSEALWEEMASFGSDLAEGPSGPDVSVVPKRNYCERCPHFGPPPEVHCTHEGTEIVEFVDSDHVKLRNCPIVAQRRGLDERYAEE